MGNAVATQSNVVHNNFQATFLEGISVTGVSTFTGQIDGNGGANISGAETVLSSATVSDLTLVVSFLQELLVLLKIVVISL